MASWNQFTGIGNATRDVQLRFLPSQTAVADWGIACNRRYKTAQGEDREEVLFLDCAAFGKLADICGQYITKGKPIFVAGRLVTEQWTDKTTGDKRSKIKLNVETMQLLGSRDGDGEDQRRPESANEHDQRPAPRPQQRPATATQARLPMAPGKAPSPAADSPYRPAAQQAAQRRPQPPVEPPFGEEQELDPASIPF